MKAENYKRFDSEFFLKEYIYIENKLKNEKSIGDIATTFELHTNGSFKSVYNIIHDNEIKEVKYIRSENIGNYFIDGAYDYISKKANKLLYKTHCTINDILVARTGKIGGVTLVNEDLVGLNANQNIVNLRLTNNEYSPFVTTIFLNSKFGKNNLLERLPVMYSLGLT